MLHCQNPRNWDSRFQNGCNSLVLQQEVQLNAETVPHSPTVKLI